MTTVAAQMFVPARPAAEFEDALAQLDGDPSPGAEQDRATLLHYLGGTQMSMRRLRRTRHTQLRCSRDPRRVGTDEPLPVVGRRGRRDEPDDGGARPDALAVLDGVAALADWTDWSADWFFARAFAQAHGGAPELAHETLCSIGARFDNVDVSPMASTVVAGFGVWPTSR